MTAARALCLFPGGVGSRRRPGDGRPRPPRSSCESSSPSWPIRTIRRRRSGAREPDASVDDADARRGSSRGPRPSDPAAARDTKRPAVLGDAVADAAAPESQTTSSPVEAMRIDEIERTRVFLKVAIATVLRRRRSSRCITGGDPIARNVVRDRPGARCVRGAVDAVRRTRRPDRYTPRKPRRCRASRCSASARWQASTTGASRHRSPRCWSTASTSSASASIAGSR